MDPATAIGVSSAVLTFVDFGFKIVRGAYHIYGATDSATEWENPRDVAAKMHQLARRMRVPTTRDLTWEEEELCELAGACQALSQELAKLFGSILPKNSKSKRQCLWAAAKLKLKDDEITGLEKRLESCREQFELHLVYANYLTGTDMKASVQQLLKDQDTSSRKLVQSIEDLKEGLQRVEKEQTKPLSLEALAQIQSAVQIQDEMIDAAVSSRILAGLAFSSMHSRYNGIEDALAETFRWFFDEDSDEESNSERDDPEEGSGGESSRDSDEEGSEASESDWTDFTESDDTYYLDEAQAEAKNLFNEWLVGPSSGILHISGKLGSGKSTLMKFLVDDPRTRQGLQAWAGGNKLVFASFFFWKAGLPEQRSLPGLLRTLLHDSLQSDPSLTPLLLPEVWATTRKDGWLTQSPVTLGDPQVREAFERLLSSPQTFNDHRFCFFIDGLDEYEERSQMDHADMVAMLQRWTDKAPQQVKICVSSREEPVFIDAFRSDRRIQIHTLTESDMYAYVSSRLPPIFPAEDSTMASKFTKEIVHKARGIFLWVTLVVKEIRRRHGNSDIGDLQMFLEYLPLDLEKLFRYILCQLIPKEDRPMAHRAFRLLLETQAWDVSVTLWEFSFINDYLEDPNFCINLPREPVEHHNDAVQSLEPARKWVQAWCRGLLEIGPEINWKDGESRRDSLCMGFSHRSIPEFLDTEEMKAESRKWTTDWNWIDAYSKMHLASCQAFSAFRSSSHARVTEGVLGCRTALGLDSDPPFAYLATLEHCVQRQNDKKIQDIAQKGSHRRAGVYCTLRNCLIRQELREEPSVQLPSIEVLPTPSMHLILLDGDHPFPCWRLGQDKTIAQDGVSITLMCIASIENSNTLATYDHPGDYPLRPGYRFLDLLANNSEMRSRILSGFRARRHPLSHPDTLLNGRVQDLDTVGVLGNYLVNWFLNSCHWHPDFQSSGVFKHLHRHWLSVDVEFMEGVVIERFGCVLERLFRIDQERLLFEAHASLGYLADRSVTRVRFVMGDQAQRAEWTCQRRLASKYNGGYEDSSGDIPPWEYTTDIPEVSEQQIWTLEDIINITSPPNRETLLRMIADRNSALSGLSTLRLDDKDTSEET